MGVSAETDVVDIYDLPDIDLSRWTGLVLAAGSDQRFSTPIAGSSGACSTGEAWWSAVGSSAGAAPGAGAMGLR